MDVQGPLQAVVPHDDDHDDNDDDDDDDNDNQGCINPAR